MLSVNNKSFISVTQTNILKNTFYLPTDTHNAESVELLKHSKIDKNDPTCLTQYTVYSDTVHDTHAVTG